MEQAQVCIEFGSTELELEQVQVVEQVHIHVLELELAQGTVVELVQAQTLDMVAVVEQVLALDMVLVE